MSSRKDNIIAQWPLVGGGFIQARVVYSVDFEREAKRGNYGYFRYIIKHACPGEKVSTVYRGIPGRVGSPSNAQLRAMPSLCGRALLVKSHRKELAEFSKLLYNLAETATWMYPHGETATTEKMQRKAQRLADVFFRLLKMKGKFYHPKRV